MRISKDLLPTAIAVDTFERKFGKLSRAIVLASGKAGLNPVELDVLDALEFGVLSQAELRTLLLVDRGQLSRCIKALVAKGMVEPKLLHKNPQSFSYSISDLGRTRLRSARRKRLATIRKILRLPKPARLQHLHNAVAQLAEAIDPKSREQNFDRCRFAELTELPGIAAAIEADCSAKPQLYDFDNRVGAFIMRELGTIASSRNCSIVVNEWFGAYAGIAFMMIDKKTLNAHFPFVWVTRFWCGNGRGSELLEMGLAKARRLGCITASASQPVSKFGFDFYEQLGWQAVDDFKMRIASATVPFRHWEIGIVQ